MSADIKGKSDQIANLSRSKMREIDNATAPNDDRLKRLLVSSGQARPATTAARSNGTMRGIGIPAGSNDRATRIERDVDPPAINTSPESMADAGESARKVRDQQGGSSEPVRGDREDPIEKMIDDLIKDALK